MEHWRVLSIDGKEVLVYGDFTDTSYEISWTELAGGVPKDCSGWTQSCGVDDFQIFSELYNPYLEGSVDVMIDKLRTATFDTASERTDFELNGCADDNERVLAIKSPLHEKGSVHFTWRYECSSIPKTKFSEIFMKPLLSLTAVLREQNELLMKTIMKKDREIEEHRANGSILKRSHLETKLFDKDSFNNDSLLTPSVKSSIRKPLPELLKNSSILQTLRSLRKQSTEPDQTALVSPKKSSPIKVKSPAKMTVKAALEARVDEAVDSTETVDETEVELKRRAEIERLKTATPPKKRKTKKSVF